MLPTRIDPERLVADPSKMVKVPMLVGTLGIVLYGDYDERQQWFDFMRGTLFFQDRPVEPPPAAKKPEKKTSSPRVYALCPPQCRQLFVHDKGMQQLTLPFHEGRKVGNGEFKSLEPAGYPGWERTDAGELLIVHISRGSADAVREWCQEHCRARFAVKSSFAVFQSVYDFTLAKLMFQKDTT